MNYCGQENESKFEKGLVGSGPFSMESTLTHHDILHIL